MTGMKSARNLVPGPLRYRRHWLASLLFVSESQALNKWCCTCNAPSIIACTFNCSYNFLYNKSMKRYIFVVIITCWHTCNANNFRHMIKYHYSAGHRILLGVFVDHIILLFIVQRANIRSKTPWNRKFKKKYIRVLIGRQGEILYRWMSV